MNCRATEHNGDIVWQASRFETSQINQSPTCKMEIFLSEALRQDGAYLRPTCHIPGLASLPFLVGTDHTGSQEAGVRGSLASV